MRVELAVRGAQVVTTAGTITADIGVTAGRVALLGREVRGEKEIDARGLLALPGLIDAHVHLEDVGGDGTPTADDFASGTASAAAGGVTTVLDFVSPEPGQDPVRAFDERRRQAERGSRVDFGLHHCLPAGIGEPAETVARMVRQGVNSFKVFTVYAGMALSPFELFRALRATAEAGAVLMLHAETGSIVDGLVREFLAGGQTAPLYHARSRPALCEETAVAGALALHAAVGGRLYLVHLSTGAAVELVARRRKAGAAVYAETCPQYLLLSEERLAGPHGERFICSPPLRPPAETERLWLALADGGIDTVATDHCPFRDPDRSGRPAFTAVPNGLGGIGFRLELLFTHGVAAGRLTLERMVELVCANPARIFGLWPRKGCLAPGADADLVLLDPCCPHSLSWADLPGREDHSVYEGFASTARVRYTLSRGEVIYDQERGVTGEPGRGRFLQRPAPPARP